MKDRKSHYWGIYTILFIFMSIAVFSFFFLEGKTFVRDSRWDAWMQHYKALIYYGKWLRTMDSFTLPAYSFSMGYGSDILTTLHYYVAGDPLNLLAVFFSEENMYYLYGGLIILRLYLAGLCFSIYGFYNGKERMAVLTGAFVYAFCGFSVCGAGINPYFINPMIYFPLLLTGVEKILKEEKTGLFVGAVFLSAVSNFYFFYMLALLTAMYVVFRLFMLYGRKESQKVLRMLFTVGGYAVIGVLLSAFLILPVLLVFLDSPRSGIEYVYHLLPSFDFLKGLPTAFVTLRDPGKWTYMGFSAVTLLMVFFLFFRDKYRYLKILFAALTMFYIFPFFGHVFNGFSYVSNRWMWGYSFLVACIVTTIWTEMKSISQREWVQLAVLSAAYFVLCILLNKTVSRSLFVSGIVVGLSLLALLVCPKQQKWHLTEPVLMGLVLMGIYGNAYCYYSVHSGNNIAQFEDRKTINTEVHDTVDQAVLAAEDPGAFYRYSGNVTDINSTVLSDLSSIHFYWSLSGSGMFKWCSQMGILENTAHCYHTLDDRAAVNTLSGVKYFVTEADDEQHVYVPYGYSKVELEDEELSGKYSLYENQYTLPLGYTYTSFITKEDFEMLSPLEKQEAILQGAALEKQPDICEESELLFTSKKVDYSLECNGSDIVQKENSFIVTGENASVTLYFDGMDEAETYLYIKGITYESDVSYQTGLTKFEMEISSVDADGVSIQKNLIYRTEEEDFATGRDEFLANLGYSDSKKTEVTIFFPETGTYTLDQLEVFCQSMKNYADQVNALRTDTLENLDMHYPVSKGSIAATNMVTGTISLDAPKILCITIPYSSGWTAYVNGEKQELLKANVMFMALELGEGEHEIQLVYSTPGVKIGIAVSALGMLLLAGLWIYKRKTQMKED